MLGLGLATLVVTPTEAVRREAIAHFRLHPARVVAVPLAASAHFRPRGPRPGGKPYFLYVGTLEPRKNIPAILEAWRRLRVEHEVELVLAGRRRDDFPSPATAPGLRVLGETPEEDLPRLYSEAVACLYPSLYEGFGLPVVEAMRCGAAVIGSRDPAVMEVAGGAAEHVEARDTAGWVRAMRAALVNPDWLAGWRERALRRGLEFSWAATARRTREVYEEAGRRFHG
jgi:glycosyltransferase involved in cell wall biosynthesis